MITLISPEVSDYYNIVMKYLITMIFSEVPVTMIFSEVPDYHDFSRRTWLL
jgi:hypothetical protein